MLLASSIHSQLAAVHVCAHECILDVYSRFETALN